MPSESLKNARTEAGRKGGIITKKKHGPDYYKKIGSMGGKAKKKVPNFSSDEYEEAK